MGGKATIIRTGDPDAVRGPERAVTYTCPRCEADLRVKIEAGRRHYHCECGFDQIEGPRPRIKP